MRRPSCSIDCNYLGRFTVVVFQQSTEPFVTAKSTRLSLHWAGGRKRDDVALTTVLRIGKLKHILSSASTEALPRVVYDLPPRAVTPPERIGARAGATQRWARPTSRGRVEPPGATWGEGLGKRLRACRPWRPRTTRGQWSVLPSDHLIEAISRLVGEGRKEPMFR
jgi:hypothetical protein